MANQNKTAATSKDPYQFIDEWVDNEQKRKDSLTLIAMMSKITGHKPKMWGPTMVGFGDWHYIVQYQRFSLLLRRRVCLGTRRLQQALLLGYLVQPSWYFQ